MRNFSRELRNFSIPFICTGGFQKNQVPRSLHLVSCALGLLSPVQPLATVSFTVLGTHEVFSAHCPAHFVTSDQVS